MGLKIKSILNVIANIKDTDIINKYFNKLLCIDGISESDVHSKFKEYSLKCIYPQNDTLIKQLISEKSSVKDFLTNKCYNFANYQTMYSMLDYLIPKYCQNNNNNEGNAENENDIFEFIKLMVIDEDFADIDNNDK